MTMEDLLLALWGVARGYDVDRVDRRALRGLQSGSLSMYRLGLLYPWTLGGVTDLVPLHGRARAIGWRQELLARDAGLPLSERAGHAADLLGCYVVQTDGELVSRGLDAAWGILYDARRGRLWLPGRTAGACRLLCQCHYFTGDAECLELAEGLVTEALGRSGSWEGEELLDWLGALRLYADVSDGVGAAALDRERLEGELRRLGARARRVEDGLLEGMRRGGGGADDAVAFSRVFAVVAGRVLADCVEAEGRKI